MCHGVKLYRLLPVPATKPAWHPAQQWPSNMGLNLLTLNRRYLRYLVISCNTLNLARLVLALLLEIFMEVNSIIFQFQGEVSLQFSHFLEGFLCVMINTSLFTCSLKYHIK